MAQALVPGSMSAVKSGTHIEDFLPHFLVLFTLWEVYVTIADEVDKFEFNGAVVVIFDFP